VELGDEEVIGGCAVAWEEEVDRRGLEAIVAVLGVEDIVNRYPGEGEEELSSW
jgi:hypothetical protein